MNVTVTLSSSCEPTIHRTGCGHLTKIRRRRSYDGEYTMEANSLAEISLEYWSDIIHSDYGLFGQEALDEAIAYLSEFEIGPCVNLPKTSETA